MNNYDDLFNRNTSSESLQNKRTEKNIAALEDIFKNSVDDESLFEDTSNLVSADNYFSNSTNGYDNKSGIGLHDIIQKSEPSMDPFNTTSEISKVDLNKALNNDLGNNIDDLKKLRGILSDYDNENSEVQNTPIQGEQSSSQANSNGKVLVKSTNPVKKFSSDTSEILQAFISCSILSFVTAGMGVGWLLYIIMHI